MPLSVRRVEYFYVMVRGAADEAGDLLNQLASQNVNLLALNLTPMGPESTQLTLFPDGRAIIKGTTDTAVARSLYARFIGS